MGRKKKTGTFDEWFSNYSQQNGIDVSGAPSSGTSYSNAGTTQQKKKTATFNDWFTNYQKENNIDLTQQRQTPSYTQQAKRYTNKPVYQQSQTPSYASNPLAQAAQNKVNAQRNGYVTGSASGDQAYKKYLSDIENQYKENLIRQNKYDPQIQEQEKKLKDLQSQLMEVGRRGDVAGTYMLNQQMSDSKDAISKRRQELSTELPAFSAQQAYYDSMSDDTLREYKNRLHQQYVEAQNNLAKASTGTINWMDREKYMDDIAKISDEESRVQSMLGKRDWNNKYQQYMGLRSQPGFDGSYQSTYNDDGRHVDPRGNLNGVGEYVSTEMNKYGDITYDYLNNDPNAEQVMHTMNPYGFRTGYGEMNSYYATLTDEEKEVFNHLYKQDPNKAYEFMDFMKDELEKRERQNNEQAAAEFATENPVAASMMSVTSAMGSPIAVASDLVSLAKTGEFNTNSWANQFSYIPQAIRTTVSNNIAENSPLGEAGSFLYNTGMSMADNIAQMLFTGGMSQSAILALMGTQVFANTVTEGVADGKSAEDILLESFVRAGVEVLTEKIGLDEVFEYIGGTRTFEQLMKAAGSEGAEEALADLLNWGFDGIRQVATGRESELYEKYNAYRLQGFSDSEALGKVLADMAKELGTDALGGALSGLAMSGAGTAVTAPIGAISNARTETRLGEQVRQMLPENHILQYETDRDIGKRVIEEETTRRDNARAAEFLDEVSDTVKKDGKANPDLIYEVMEDAAAKKILAEKTSVESIETGLDAQQALAEYAQTHGTESSQETTEAKRQGNSRPINVYVNQGKSELRNRDIMLPLRQYSEVTPVQEIERNRIDTMAAERFGEAGSQVWKSAVQNAGIDAFNVKARQELFDDFAKAFNAGMNDQAIPEGLRFSDYIAQAAYASGKNAALDMFRDKSGRLEKEFTTSDSKKPGLEINSPLVREAIRERLISRKDLKGFGEMGVRLETKLIPMEHMPQNGWYQDGKIGFSLDASNGLFHVLSHEFTHRLQEAAPEEYEKLKNHIAEFIGSDELEKALTKYYDLAKSYGMEMSQTTAMDEVVADWVADHMVKGDLQWTGFLQQASRTQEGRGLLARIRTAIRNIISKLKGSKNADINQMTASLQKAQQLIDEALKAAEKNVKAISAYNINSLDQTETVLEDENGDPVANFHEDGSVAFSLRSYEESGRSVYLKYLNKLVKSGELLQAEADDMLNELDTIYRISKEFADTGKYAPFTAWSNAEVIYDSKGKPVFSAVKKNSEYKMNIDFSTICKKRRTLDAVFREMITRGIMENLDLNQEESAAMVVNINDLIRKHGFEAACALCFVEARRYRQQQTATTFRDMWNGLVESMYKDKSKIEYFNFGKDSTVQEVPDGIHTMDNKQLDLKHVREVANAKNEDGKLLQTAEAKAARLLLKDPSQRKLMRIGDMMASTGFENMQIQNPQLMKIYNSKKGTGGAKSSFGDVQYLNEIIKSNTFNRRAAYAVSGVRIQSFSDYVPRMVFDYVQVIADLAAKKLPAHAYTKEVLFAKQFGLTGAKINLSLVPDVVKNGVAPGLDAKGNYIWNKEGTFPFDEAMKLQQAEGYKENCGTIAVGISDEQIMKMLADPNIQMVIPYHKSSLNPIVAAMTNVDRFTNYEDSQNTKDENGKTLSSSKDFAWDDKLFDLTHDKNGKQLPKDKWGNVQDLVQEYVSWCNDRNYTPKFSQFLYMEDGSINPGYYKLLEDFALLDNDGNFKPQGDVQMRFPTETDAFGSMTDLIKQGLSEDTKLEKKRSAQVSGIVDEIQTMIDNETIAKDKRFSLRNAPAFYSQLERTVEQYKGDKIGASSLIPYLKGKGVKDEEIKWSGIATFLEGKKSVSKTDVVQFARDNALKIDETVLSENPTSPIWTNGRDTVNTEHYYEDETGAEFENAEQFKKEAIRRAIEEGWTEDEVEFDIQEEYGYMEATVDFDHVILRVDTPSVFDLRDSDFTNETAARWGGYKTPGGTNYREILFKIPGSEYSNDAMKTHWGSNNKGVVAHARIQDFGDILFVEEIQSDWHNAGEKNGYGASVDYSAERKRLRAEYNGIRDEIDRLTQWRSDHITEMSKVERRISSEMHYAEWAVYAALTNQEDQYGIEDDRAEEIRKRATGQELKLYSEEKNNTDKLKSLHDQSDRVWRRLARISDIKIVPDVPFRNGKYVDFALKSLLRLATEENKDYLAWTTGAMQEERWSDEYAEGYRIEYDQDIPKFLKKYGKQWGASLTEIVIGDGQKVPAIKITDAMKESVITEGQPMFSLRQQDAEYLELAKDPEKNKAKLQRMVDEAALQIPTLATTQKNNRVVPLHLYHGTPSFGFTQFADDNHKVPFIYTSTKSIVSANYAGDNHYAGVRNINRKYDGGNSVESIIKDAENIWGTKYHVATEEEKSQAFTEVRNQAVEVADEIDARHTDLDLDWNNDDDNRILNAIAWVENLFWGMRDSDFTTLEELRSDEVGYTPGDVLNDIERFKDNIQIVKDYYLDNYQNLSKEQKEYLSYLNGYEVGDAAIYIEYRIGRILSNDTVLTNEQGGFAIPGDLRESLDSIHNIGSYDLYGDLGERPFEFDANGAQFWAIKVPEIGDDYYSTDAICKWAQENGYTSVIMHNIYDYGDKADNYVFFDSSQLKSADPVTYDDAGNVIPLSERFNPEKKDIRYSLRGSQNIVESAERDASIRNGYMEAATNWRKNMTAFNDFGRSGFNTNMNALIKDYNSSLDKTTTEKIVGQIRQLTRDMVSDKKMEYSDIVGRANEIAAKVLWGKEGTTENLLFNEDAGQAIDDIRNDIMAQILKTVTRGEGKYQRLSQEFADYRKKANASISEVRQKRDARIDQMKQQRQAERERRSDSKERATLLKTMKRLDSISKHASEANKALIQELIGDFNKVSRSLTEGKADNLKQLAKHIQDHMSADPNFMPTERALRDLDRLSQKNIADLSIEEVRMLNQALLNIEHEMRTNKKLVDSNYRQHINEIGNMIIDGVQNTRGIGNSKYGVFNWFQQTLDKTVATPVIRPETEFLRLVGFDRSNPLYQLTYGDNNSLASGQRDMVRYKWQANKKYVDQFLNDRAFANEIMGKKARACEIIGRRSDGKMVTLKVTPDMLMALYMHAQNRQNFQHFGIWNNENGTQYGGGITIPDFELYRKGKIQEAYRVGTRNGNLITMTKSSLNAAFKQLTEKEMSFVRAAQAYYSEMSQPEINRISNLLLGYSIAQEENYFRINTDSNYRGTNMDAIKFDGTIEGMGWTKERMEGARNPILLISLTEQFARDIDAHAKYIGLAIPVRNFNKAYGVNRNSYTEDGEFRGTVSSVQSAITGKWGDGATDYIQKLMSDIQNPKTTSEGWSKIFGKLRSFYAGSVLALNAGVAIKQAASYPTAAAEIGWAPLIKAFGNTRLSGKMDMDIVNKYSPLMYLRTQGMGYQELADLKNLNKGWLNRALNSKALNWIQDMDVMTVKKLWKACEYYVRDNFKDLKVGTEEYYQKVGEMHSKVIERTQPNYTTLQRGEILRSDSDFVRMALGMFKTQPFQNFSVLFEATGELSAACRAYKVNPNETTNAMRKAAVKKMARALSSQLVASLIFAIMQAAWDWIRGRDDKYKDEEGNLSFASAFKQIGINMGSNAFGMIPLGSVLYEVIETTVDTISKNNGGDAVFNATAYGLDASTATGIVNDLVDAIGTLAKNASSIDLDSKNTTEKHIRDYVGILATTAQAFGYPAENFVKDGQAIALNVFRTLGASGSMNKYEAEYYSKRIFSAVTSQNKKEYLELLYRAYDNDRDAYNKLYSLYTENEGFATSSKSSKEYIDDKMKAHIKEQTTNQNRDKVGLSDNDMTKYQEYLDRYDANHNGKYTQEEVYNALMAIDFSMKQKEELWNENGWKKSFSEYGSKKK